MSTPTIEAVAERLDGLERENRRLRWIAVGMFVAASVLVTESRLAKFPNVRGVVEAEKVVIRDKQGRLRATLGLDATDMPGLKMYDSRGLQQVSLETPSDATSMLAFYDKGQSRMMIESAIDGSTGLRFFDKGEKSSSALFMGPEGSTGLTFNMGKQSLVMGVQPNGESALFTTDADGDEVGRIGADSVDSQTLGIVRDSAVTMQPAPVSTARRPFLEPDRAPLSSIRTPDTRPRGRELPVDPAVRSSFRGASN